MELDLVFRYLHFISIFIVVGALVSEFVLIGNQMTGKALKKVAKIDSFYGLGSVLFVGAGLALWLWVGKPAEYYTQNWIFMVKLSLAVLLGILSIPPTIFFFKFRKSENDEDLVLIPKYVRVLIRLEMLLLFIIPFCAVLMARGYGYNGE